MGRKRGSRYPPGVDGRTVPKPAYLREMRRQEALDVRRRDWKRNFLRAYVEFGTVRKACEVAGVSRAVYNQARRDDPEFEEALQFAWQDGTDRVIETVWQHAVEGVREEIVWQGEIIGYRVVKDVKAAKWLAEVRDPAVYSQRERIARMGMLDPQQVAARKEQMLADVEQRIKAFIGGSAEVEDAETVDDTDMDTATGE